MHRPRFSSPIKNLVRNARAKPRRTLAGSTSDVEEDIEPPASPSPVKKVVRRSSQGHIDQNGLFATTIDPHLLAGVTPESLQSMPRRELMSLCKRLGLKAGGKNVALIARIETLLPLVPTPRPSTSLDKLDRSRENDSGPRTSSSLSQSYPPFLSTQRGTPSRNTPPPRSPSPSTNFDSSFNPFQSQARYYSCDLKGDQGEGEESDNSDTETSSSTSGDEEEDEQFNSFSKVQDNQINDTSSESGSSSLPEREKSLDQHSEQGSIVELKVNEHEEPEPNETLSKHEQTELSVYEPNVQPEKHQEIVDATMHAEPESASKPDEPMELEKPETVEERSPEDIERPMKTEASSAEILVNVESKTAENPRSSLSPCKFPEKALRKSVSPDGAEVADQVKSEEADHSTISVPSALVNVFATPHRPGTKAVTPTPYQHLPLGSPSQTPSKPSACPQSPLGCTPQSTRGVLPRNVATPCRDATNVPPASCPPKTSRAAFLPSSRPRASIPGAWVCGPGASKGSSANERDQMEERAEVQQHQPELLRKEASTASPSFFPESEPPQGAEAGTNAAKDASSIFEHSHAARPIEECEQAVSHSLEGRDAEKECAPRKSTVPTSSSATFSAIGARLLAEMQARMNKARHSHGLENIDAKKKVDEQGTEGAAVYPSVNPAKKKLTGAPLAHAGWTAPTPKEGSVSAKFAAAHDAQFAKMPSLADSVRRPGAGMKRTRSAASSADGSRSVSGNTVSASANPRPSKRPRPTIASNSQRPIHMNREAGTNASSDTGMGANTGIKVGANASARPTVCPGPRPTTARIPFSQRARVSDAPTVHRNRAQCLTRRPTKAELLRNQAGATRAASVGMTSSRLAPPPALPKGEHSRRFNHAFTKPASCAGPAQKPTSTAAASNISTGVRKTSTSTTGPTSSGSSIQHRSKAPDAAKKSCQPPPSGVGARIIKPIPKRHATTSMAPRTPANSAMKGHGETTQQTRTLEAVTLNRPPIRMPSVPRDKPGDPSPPTKSLPSAGICSKGRTANQAVKPWARPRPTVAKGNGHKWNTVTGPSVKPRSSVHRQSGYPSAASRPVDDARAAARRNEMAARARARRAAQAHQA